MLSLEQCKKYLSPETLKRLSDEEILKVRDALNDLAELALDIVEQKHKNGEGPNKSASCFFIDPFNYVNIRLRHKRLNTALILNPEKGQQNFLCRNLECHLLPLFCF
ncbi:MAG: hypothetical protein WC531_01070 [Candidatus Paceibacterota bacterium]|jgi:hypothetical protein